MAKRRNTERRLVLEQCVDERRCRGVREDQEHAKQQEDDQQRQHPPFPAGLEEVPVIGEKPLVRGILEEPFVVAGRVVRVHGQDPYDERGPTCWRWYWRK